MPRLYNQFATASITLAADVTNTSTFTLSYPSGTTQNSFSFGQAANGSYMIVNSNDRWTVGSPGISISYGASLITVTNNTGATLVAGTPLVLMFERADGFSRIPLTIPLPSLAAIANGTVVNSIYPGIEGTIEQVDFVTSVPVTTASRAATLNVAINGTIVTGSPVAVTSALATPMGATIRSTPTALNTITRDSAVTVTASSVTAFAEGSGFLVIYIRPTYDNIL